MEELYEENLIQLQKKSKRGNFLLEPPRENKEPYLKWLFMFISRKTFNFSGKSVYELFPFSEIHLRFVSDRWNQGRRYLNFPIINFKISGLSKKKIKNTTMLNF